MRSFQRAVGRGSEKKITTILGFELPFLGHNDGQVVFGTLVKCLAICRPAVSFRSYRYVFEVLLSHRSEELGHQRLAEA